MLRHGARRIRGSFIRGGDGDRRLSHYEVTQLLSNRTQPTFDREAVVDASVADLDEALVEAYLARIRRRSSAFRKTEKELLLVRLGILTPDPGGVLRPTVAGLMCLGEYPQQFFPQLLVSFVVLPGLRMGETGPDGRRFLDVMAELRRVGMSPPEFDVTPARVVVKLPQHALLAPDTIAWIGSLNRTGPTDEQHLALAMMRATGRVTNAMLQVWGVDRLVEPEES